MDIRIRESDAQFTLRAAALIIDNDRLLLVRDNAHDSYYTPGGKVRMGESSQQAVLREIKEETGCTFTLDRLVFVQERLFTFDQKRHHEICFYYLLHLPDHSLPHGTHTDQPFESLHWLHIGNLSKHKIVPSFLCERINNLPDQPQHIIANEP